MATPFADVLKVRACFERKENVVKAHALRGSPKSSVKLLAVYSGEGLFGLFSSEVRTCAKVFLWGVDHGLLQRPLLISGMVVEGRRHVLRNELNSSPENSLTTASGTPCPVLMCSISSSMAFEESGLSLIKGGM